MDEGIRREQRPWASSDSLRYYREERNDPAHLYESERHFLPEVLKQAGRVLDVGCAAGGFFPIMRSFNPGLRYVGVDITPELIEIARKDHPDAEFHLCDGVEFPFLPGSFDLVHCSGVLHLNTRYGDMVRAMWAQTSRHLLCDFRLTLGPGAKGEFEINFGRGEVSDVLLPYHVLRLEEVLALLCSLEPRPAAIRAKGTTNPVSPTARLEPKEAIMPFFLLEKGRSERIRLELALDI